VLLVLLAAYFAPTVTGTAAASATALQTARIGQYEGLKARQYHDITWSSGAGSASLSGTSKLNESISTGVISPSFTSRSPDSIPKIVIQSLSPTAAWIPPRNDRPIDSEVASGTNRDPRVMLDIAAVLGLCYLGFLAVWFWATRVRMRPRSSTPS